MWQQSTKVPMESNITELDKDKCQQEFGDSGFVSGTSLICSEEVEVVSSELESQTTPSSAPELMRAPDSGVDLGLSESLSTLSLKHNTLNSLDKVHTEPTKLTPVSAKADVPSVTTSPDNSEHYSRTEDISQEPWEIYYTQDDDGDTQLHIAVVQGYLEAVFCLVNMAPHPCLLDVLNDDGQAALHLSVLTHQPRIARCLILAGANPQTRNIRGNTALHLACACVDIDCAKALTDPLSPGERNLFPPGRLIPALPQDLEQRNYNGEMCIHVAATTDNVELMRLLLRLGADLEAKEGLAGKTALHLAVENNCKLVLKFLLEECNPQLDATTYGGMTAYQMSLYHDPQISMDLVRYGAKQEPISSDDSESDDSSSEEDSHEDDSSSSGDEAAYKHAFSQSVNSNISVTA